MYDSSEEFQLNVDPSECDELKQCKDNLFYLADLHSKFNEVQKRLHGNFFYNFSSSNNHTGLSSKNEGI